MKILWFFLTAGSIGGAWLWLQQPATAGAAPGAPFRWAMLWAGESSLPPSDRLSPYTGPWLERLLGPLEAKVPALAHEELARLEESFRAEAHASHPERLPVYAAAIQVTHALAAAVEARRIALKDFAASQANTLGYLDPRTGRIGSNRAFFENAARNKWEHDAAQFRTTISSWYAQLRERERQLHLDGPMPE